MRLATKESCIPLGSVEVETSVTVVRVFLLMSFLINDELRVLLSNKEKLAEALKSADLIQLCKELLSYQVLVKKTALAFLSLDHAKLDKKLKIKFLLQQVCRGVEVNPELCYKFISVLMDTGSDAARSVSVYIESQLGEARNGVIKDEVNVVLEKEDVQILMDILNNCSNKWDDIGFSLGFPEHVIKAIDKENISVNGKMRNVLGTWFTGFYKPATLTQLKQALETPSVSENYLAENLENEFVRLKELNGAFPVKRAKVELSFSIEHQSIDIEIEDGKSVILGVQVNCNELVGYQWMKNGQHLVDGDVYSDTQSDVLLVHRASQETAGVYTCEIEGSNGTLKTHEIVLTVSYSKGKRQLLNKYSKLLEVPNDSWCLASTGKFINLALIKESCQAERADKHVARGDINSLLQRKERVTYEEVFGQYESGALIMVEGRPGSGKTTLACKIARDWAREGNVLKYLDQVFLLPLRGYQKKSILRKIFDNVLQRAEETDGEGFCLILDGLDEWQRKHDTDEQIHDLLIKDLLPNAMIIVMSRPAATMAYRQYATKRIEVLGFSIEQIYEYIEAYPFANKAVAGGLKAYLKVYTNVLHMCYLPVNAAMICFLYSLIGDNMPQTETQIYEYFTRSIILRKLQQEKPGTKLKVLEELPKECREHFKDICVLAYNMTCNSKQTISEADLPLDSQSPPFSLLTTDRIAQSYGAEGVITFLHLTHQEYLAACHIATMTPEEQSEAIDLFGGKEEMRATWKFYCGVFTKTSKRSVARFEQLMNAMETSHLFKIQCAYESQEKQFCNKVVELLSGEFRFNSHVIMPGDFTAVRYFLENTTCPLFSFSMQMCTSHELQKESKELESIELSSILYEPTPKATIKKMVKMFPSIVDKYFKLSPKYRTEFIQGAKKAYYGLLSINLSKFGINADTISDLLGYFSKGKSTILTSEYAAPLIQALKCPTLNLSRLDLSTNIFGPEGASVIAKIIQHRNNLQGLNISVNLIGSEGAVHLAEGLRYFTGLEYLNLSANDIGYEGEKAIAEGITNLKLKIFNLSWNNISTAQLFANQTELETLNLSATNIAPACLRGELTFSPTLRILNLSQNNIDSSGAIMVARALKTCTELCELNLSCNSIGYEGAEAIANVVTSNIKVLDMSHNEIGDRCCSELAKKLKALFSDVKLNVSHNAISSLDRIEGQDVADEIKRLVEFLSCHSEDK